MYESQSEKKALILKFIEVKENQDQPQTFFEFIEVKEIKSRPSPNNFRFHQGGGQKKILKVLLLGVFSSSNKSRSCWIFSVLSKVDYLVVFKSTSKVPSKVAMI